MSGALLMRQWHVFFGLLEVIVGAPTHIDAAEVALPLLQEKFKRERPGEPGRPLITRELRVRQKREE